MCGGLAAGCELVKIKLGASWGSNVEHDLARMQQPRGPPIQLRVTRCGVWGSALRGIVFCEAR